MKILCQTLFDCSRTGITGHFKADRLPFMAKSGLQIETPADWHRARNQQRNWETLLQILGLRTQPMDLSDPTLTDGRWQFEFTVETPAVFNMPDSQDPLAALKQDCAGVPMITGLGETQATDSVLILEGDQQNIWLHVLNRSTDIQS